MPCQKRKALRDRDGATTKGADIHILGWYQNGEVKYGGGPRALPRRPPATGLTSNADPAAFATPARNGAVCPAGPAIPSLMAFGCGLW